MYKLQPESMVRPTQVVKRLSDNTFIPFAEDNTDYAEYLRWLEAGNTPIPADEENK